MRRRKPFRFAEAEGRIAAEMAAPYPPESRSSARRERYSREMLELMRQYKADGCEFHGPSDASLEVLYVLKRNKRKRKSFPAFATETAENRLSGKGDELRMKKMISWNVNGLRACMKKGFQEYFDAADADIFLLQETKLQEGQIDLELARLSSVLELCGKERIFRYGPVYQRGADFLFAMDIGIEEHDTEGRVITAEFPEYFVVTVYTPNSQDELKRLGLPDGVGGCVSFLLKRTGAGKTGDFLRRSERRSDRDGYQKCKGK